jgi:hypothetical protein
LSANLGQYVHDIFESFKDSKRQYEIIAEELWYNFLGQYQPGLNWKKAEGSGSRSRIFVKLTELKVGTAHSMLSDAGLPAGQVPFNAEAQNTTQLIRAGIPEEVIGKAVRAREQLISQALAKGKVAEVIDESMLDMCILGLGIIKGPFPTVVMEPQIRPKVINGLQANLHDSRLSPFEVVQVPTTVLAYESIPWWEYFVDANAKSPKDSIGEGQFRRLLPQHFRDLALSPGYDKEAIDEVAEQATTDHADDEWYFKQLGDNFTGVQDKKDTRVGVFEYQGLVPVGLLKEHLEDEEVLPEQFRPKEMENQSIEAIVVIAGDMKVVKAVPNLWGRRQYKVCPYKKRPHSIFASSVAETMRDSQKIINSAYRLMIDNKRISGSGMLAASADDIDWKRTKKVSIDSGKTIWTKGKRDPEKAIGHLRFPDVSHGLRELAADFKLFADEETGLPSITHGTQSPHLNKTARGMAMLMRNANRNIRKVMRNVDDFIIEPIVTEVDDYLTTIGGHSLPFPLKLTAQGTDSLLAKELQLEDLIKFLQIVGSNPEFMRMVDSPKILREISSLLDIDAVKTDEQIKQAAQQLAELKAKNPRWIEEFDVDKVFNDLPPELKALILMQVGAIPKPPASSAGPAPQQALPGGAAPPVPADSGGAV